MQRVLQRAMSSTSSAKRLRGVVFDMDGTLTTPNLDFTEMYQRCNVPLDQDLLAAIDQMEPDAAAHANRVIDEMEEEGRRTLQLEPGAATFAKWLHFHNIPTAVVTRNTAETVAHLHELWEADGVPLPRLHPAIARDDPPDLPAKPNPAAMAIIAKEWNVSDFSEILMVGDSPSNDVVFGQRAGTQTALVDSGRRHVEEQDGEPIHGADFRVDHLALLPHLLWEKYEIGAGALQNSDHLPTSHAFPKPLPPTTEIELAAFNGDLPTIQQLVSDSQAGRTRTRHLLDVGDDDGMNSAIVWASEGGFVDCVKALVAGMGGVDGRGGDLLDQKGYMGATAVSRAARRGHADILDVLLAAGANPDIGNDKLQFPLHIAAFHNQTDAVNVLLKWNANTYVLDRKGRTPAEDTKDASLRDAILSVRC